MPGSLASYTIYYTCAYSLSKIQIRIFFFKFHGQSGFFSTYNIHVLIVYQKYKNNSTSFFRLGETYTRTRKSGSSSELSTEVPGSSTATPGSSSSIPGSRSSTPGSSSSIPGSSSSTPGLNEDPNAPIARKSKP